MKIVVLWCEISSLKHDCVVVLTLLYNPILFRASLVARVELESMATLIDVKSLLNPCIKKIRIGFQRNVTKTSQDTGCMCLSNDFIDVALELFRSRAKSVKNGALKKKTRFMK